MDPGGKKTNKNKTKQKENKKPQTCKHNIAHEERNMIFSCHNTISAQLKKTFQPRSLCRKMPEVEKTQRYCLSDSVLSFFLFLFVLHEKETLVSNLLLWQTKGLPVIRQIRKRIRRFKYKETTLATQRHLNGRYREERSSAEPKVSLEIILFGFSSHSSALLNLQEQNGWAPKTTHDFRNHSYKGSNDYDVSPPWGLECDLHMP